LSEQDFPAIRASYFELLADAPVHRQAVRSVALVVIAKSAVGAV
jgi:hypothetical protein